MEIAVAMTRRIDGVVAVVDRLTRRLAEARLHPDEQALHGMADDWLRKLRGPAQGRPTVEVLLARSVASGSSYHAVVVGRAPYAGRRHKDTRRSVRRHRRALAERRSGSSAAGRSLWPPSGT
jgi:hypothetical protein